MFLKVSPLRVRIFFVIFLLLGYLGGFFQISTAHAAAPNAPSNFSGKAIWTDKISLTWQDNSQDETGFKIERKLGFITQTFTVGANITAYMDTGLTANTAYSYSVYAYNAQGNSAKVGPITVTTPQTPPLNPEWVGKTPILGDSYQVAMTGNYIYVTTNIGLVVLDGTIPSKILVKSNLELPGTFAIATSGNYAYVGITDSGKYYLKTINISNPISPVLVGSLELSDSISGLFVSGSKLYIANYLSGLKIADISNPASPQLIGSGLDTSGQANGVAVSQIGTQTIAVLADGSAGIQIIDVTNASSLSLLKTLSTSANANGVTTSGSYAYVGANTAGLQVVNISIPASASIISSRPAEFSASTVQIAVSGNYAYAANASSLSTSNGLQTFDVSNPSSPVKKSFLAYAGVGSRGSIAASGNKIAAAGGQAGLSLLDTTNASNPNLAGNVPIFSQPKGLAMSNSHLFTLSSGSKALIVYNISNPESPSHIATMNLEGPNDIKINGNYAFVSDSKTIKVINIQNPSTPALTATLNLSDYAYKLFILNNKLYIANYLSGLKIADISNPASPQLIGSGLDTSGQANGVAVSQIGTQTIAILADGSAGIQIIDVTNASSPALLKNISGYNTTNAVNVGSYSYIAAKQSGVLAVSISNPANAAVVGTVSPPFNGSAADIAYSVPYLYAAHSTTSSTSSGLQSIDISIPSSPIQVNFLATPGYRGGNLALMGGYAFVTDEPYFTNVASLGNTITEVPLELTKSVSVSSASRGDTFTYTLNVTNPTLNAVSELNISDAIPIGATYVSGSASDSGTCSNPSDPNQCGTLRWVISSLASGGTKILTFRVTVN